MLRDFLIWLMPDYARTIASPGLRLSPRNFMIWLLPYYFGPMRKCALCGKANEKAEMCHTPDNRYYCNQAEADEAAENWFNRQW
jgi:hypothetical protein